MMRSSRITLFRKMTDDLMTVFISLLFTIALVAGIAWALHRYQARATEVNADRHQPLPPLESGESRQTGESPVDGADADDNEQEPGEEPGVPEQSRERDSRNWQRECQQLKARGELDAALSLCRRIYPQWQSFEQQAVILRMKLRQARKDGEDIAPLLDELYLVAARASCLHDKSPGTNITGPARLRRLMPREDLLALEMPYEKIGYQKLRLLTKTDKRLLVEHRGEPPQHQSARDHHGDTWRQRLAGER